MYKRQLSDSLQVPVGLILNAIGGSPAEAWIDRKTLEFEFPDILYDWKQHNFIQDWARERAALNIRKSTNKRQRHPYEPCYLYESGIQMCIRDRLWGVALLNYMGRQMLSTMKSAMMIDITELESATNFGRLMAVFLWIYGLMSPVAGMIADLSLIHICEEKHFQIFYSYYIYLSAI